MLEGISSELENLIKQVNSKILAYSGIYVAASQHVALAEHIKKQAAVRGMTAAEL